MFSLYFSLSLTLVTLGRFVAISCFCFQMPQPTKERRAFLPAPKSERDSPGWGRLEKRGHGVLAVGFRQSPKEGKGCRVPGTERPRPRAPSPTRAPRPKIAET